MGFQNLTNYLLLLLAIGINVGLLTSLLECRHHTLSSADLQGDRHAIKWHVHLKSNTNANENNSLHRKMECTKGTTRRNKCK